MIARRRMLSAGMFASLLAAVRPRVVAAGNRAPSSSLKPDPSLFRSGDFVWPKKAGDYVPYAAGTGSLLPDQEPRDAALWYQERDEYLQSLSSEQKLDSVDRERINILKAMTFREFLAVYEADQQLNTAWADAKKALYVGHVGILELDESHQPWVIEAVRGAGVRRMLYRQWIAQRDQDLVWLGRLGNQPAPNREKIALEAKKYLGRPYKFWNFNLDDDSGFYCSKLIWLAIFRSLELAVDGNREPRRRLWFSPKQLLHTNAMDHLFNPAPYLTLPPTS